MTETEFNALAAQGYNRIPVSLETFADLDTPLSIYMKLANGPYTYLLESVQGGERFGRYSIIGLAAQTRIVVNGHQVLVLTGNRIAEREDDTNPLDFIGKYMQRFRAPPASVFHVSGSPRKAAANVSTKTTLSLSIGATLLAGPSCSARK